MQRAVGSVLCPETEVAVALGGVAVHLSLQSRVGKLLGISWLGEVKPGTPWWPKHGSNPRVRITGNFIGELSVLCVASRGSQWVPRW